MIIHEKKIKIIIRAFSKNKRNKNEKETKTKNTNKKSLHKRIKRNIKTLLLYSIPPFPFYTYLLKEFILLHQRSGRRRQRNMSFRPGVSLQSILEPLQRAADHGQRVGGTLSNNRYNSTRNIFNKRHFKTTGNQLFTQSTLSIPLYLARQKPVRYRLLLPYQTGPSLLGLYLDNVLKNTFCRILLLDLSPTKEIFSLKKTPPQKTTYKK